MKGVFQKEDTMWEMGKLDSQGQAHVVIPTASLDL